ncbi:MAG: hypothetical protein ACE5OY_09070, partial [Candidatus Bathyarchaeia archaeon]
KTVMRVALYPLIGILHLSRVAYSLFAFSPELGVVVAGFVASALIGAMYVALSLMLLAREKRLRRLASSFDLSIWQYLGS